MEISLEGCENAKDVAERLREIAKMVEKGYTGSLEPYWKVLAQEDRELLGIEVNQE